MFPTMEAMDPFDWIHFEGRNVEEVEAMMKHARHMVTLGGSMHPQGSSAKVSVEIEKPRPAKPRKSSQGAPSTMHGEQEGSNIVERLVPYADCVMCSHAYATGEGYDSELVRIV